MLPGQRNKADTTNPYFSLCLFKRNFVAPTCSHFGKKALSRMVTMGARGMMSFHAITHRQGSETRRTHIRRVTNTIGLSSTTHIHISMVIHCRGSETQTSATTAMGLKHRHQQPLPWVWNTDISNHCRGSETQTSATTAVGLKHRHQQPLPWVWNTDISNHCHGSETRHTH